MFVLDQLEENEFFISLMFYFISVAVIHDFLIWNGTIEISRRWILVLNILLFFGWIKYSLIERNSRSLSKTLISIVLLFFIYFKTYYVHQGFFDFKWANISWSYIIIVCSFVTLLTSKEMWPVKLLGFGFLLSMSSLIYGKAYQGHMVSVGELFTAFFGVYFLLYINSWILNLTNYFNDRIYFKIDKSNIVILLLIVVFYILSPVYLPKHINSFFSFSVFFKSMIIFISVSMSVIYFLMFYKIRIKIDISKDVSFFVAPLLMLPFLMTIWSLSRSQVNFYLVNLGFYILGISFVSTTLYFLYKNNDFAYYVKRFLYFRSNENKPHEYFHVSNFGLKSIDQKLFSIMNAMASYVLEIQNMFNNVMMYFIAGLLVLLMVVYFNGSIVI